MPVVVGVVLGVVVIATYLTFTAGRLDRVAARVEAAWSALDAQLVRRAAAAGELAAYARRTGALDPARADAVADAALSAREADEGDTTGRAKVENVLSCLLRETLDAGLTLRDEQSHRLLDDLMTASIRVAFARQFLDDAARDEHALRAQRVCRLLSTRRAAPRGRIDLDDPTLPEMPGAAAPVS